MQYLQLKVRNIWQPGPSRPVPEDRRTWLFMQVLVLLSTLNVFLFANLPISTIWQNVLRTVFSSTLFLIYALYVWAQPQKRGAWFLLPTAALLTAFTALAWLAYPSGLRSAGPGVLAWALLPTLLIPLISIALTHVFHLHIWPRIPWKELWSLSTLKSAVIGIGMGGLLGAQFAVTGQVTPGILGFPATQFSLSTLLIGVLIAVAALGEELFLRQVVYTFLRNRLHLSFGRIMLQIVAMSFLLYLFEAARYNLLSSAIIVIVFRLLLSVINTAMRHHSNSVGICIFANIAFSLIYWLAGG